jgi:hypothetical protein
MSASRDAVAFGSSVAALTARRVVSANGRRAPRSSRARDAWVGVQYYCGVQFVRRVKMLESGCNPASVQSSSWAGVGLQQAPV